MSNQKRKKGASRHSSGVRTAIVYFSSILVFMIIIGGAAIYILQNYVMTDKKDTTDDNNIIKGIYTPQKSDNKTVLLLGVNESSLETVVLMRFIPTKPAILFIPLSKDTIMADENTLSSVYKSGGSNGVIKAIEDEFELDIQKYLKTNREGWSKLIDGVGGLKYSIPANITYVDSDGITVHLDADGSVVSLWGEDLHAIMTYNSYSTGQDFNCKMVGSILSGIVNKAVPDDKGKPSMAISNMDSIFNNVYNLSETDITAFEFKENKDAIKYIVNKEDIPSMFKILTGEWKDGKFIPSDNAKNMINDFFSLES